MQAYCGTSSSLGCLASCTFGEMRAVVELQMSLGEVWPRVAAAATALHTAHTPATRRCTVQFPGISRLLLRRLQ